MADEKKAPEITPPPEPSPVSRPAAPAPVGKAGFDLLRPFRLAKGFIWGTVGNALDGTANWARKGMWVGAGLGLLAAIAGFGIPMLLIGAIAGFSTGAIAGGAFGLATGGIQGASRAARGEKYAEDIAAKATAAKQRPTMTMDYRDAYRAQRLRDNYQLDRVQQQERELEQETKTASTQWRDHVSQGGGHGHSRGGW